MGGRVFKTTRPPLSGCAAQSENIMLFVSASEVSASELAMLGNNIRPRRRPARRNPDERANRRVLAAVNRSLATLQERIDRLHPIGQKPALAVSIAS
jgi:hypothetical protein